MRYPQASVLAAKDMCYVEPLLDAAIVFGINFNFAELQLL